MTREIVRHLGCQDEEEARLFGGPFWNDWKHSLLSYLKIEQFPDENTEKLLHDWWCLRMRFKNGLISREEFDDEKNKIFPPDSDELENNDILAQGVRYITNRVSKTDEGQTKIKMV